LLLTGLSTWQIRNRTNRRRRRAARARRSAGTDHPETSAAPGAESATEPAGVAAVIPQQ
jgi:hypothetical protein